VIPAPVATAWIVHSRNGITALAWPIDPPNDRTAPDAPEAVPDPPKEIQP
jgi:hypothetical protein